KLTQGARENTALAAEKTQLVENLAARTDELAGLGDVLRQTSERLNLTQEDRDKLRQQLADKLAQIAQLNSKLDLLLKQQGQLKSQSQSLAAANADLEAKRLQVEGQRAAAAAQRDSLAETNQTLGERLEALSAQLEEKLAALDSLTRDREQLQKQSRELDALVAALRAKLQEAGIQLAAADQASAAKLAESKRTSDELQSRLAASAQQAADYLAQLKRAEELAAGLQQQNQRLQQAMTAADQQHQRQLLEEGRNNRELVGLRGPLKRVALVIDASGSMRQSGAAGAADRWADAQAIAAKWLRHLNVEECVLIVFSSSVRTFPADGALVDLRGESGRDRREALLKQLQLVAPGGSTNTLDALRKAYAYDVDTILLFSDGAPSRADTGVFDPAMAREIYQLCRQHQNVPVNTVGLGNYFDAALATFLQTVAEITGGTFRGQ
ncbi:MAG: VWA domain-containing protein, partial [Pirellulales bacterium]|nr:VWA domain-containing protein [Pirellulales bacterium]